MFGLMVFLALGVYLAVSVWVVWLSARWAKKRGRRSWVWGGVAAFIMYNLVFWDWIPTVATHQYYCAKESGFWVYKTLDQWKAENPGVMEGLVANEVSSQSVFDGESYTSIDVLNQRFQWITEKQNLISYLPIYRWQSQVVDAKNGKVIARWVDFSRGKGSDDLRFWLSAGSCHDGIENRNKLFHFADALIKMTNTAERDRK